MHRNIAPTAGAVSILEIKHGQQGVELVSGCVGGRHDKVYVLTRLMAQRGVRLLQQTFPHQHECMHIADLNTYPHMYFSITPSCKLVQSHTRSHLHVKPKCQCHWMGSEIIHRKTYTHRWVHMVLCPTHTFTHTPYACTDPSPPSPNTHPHTRKTLGEHNKTPNHSHTPPTQSPPQQSGGAGNSSARS